MSGVAAPSRIRKRADPLTIEESFLLALLAIMIMGGALFLFQLSEMRLDIREVREDISGLRVVMRQEFGALSDRRERIEAVLADRLPARPAESSPRSQPRRILR